MAGIRATSTMTAVERMLSRHTLTHSPESRLVVALLARAILDQCMPSQRRSAEAFLAGTACTHWCQMVGLDPAYVREMAMRWKTAKQGDQHA